jgi:Mycothiol maleylpyruvate isomerase N-terminal domain
MVPTLPSNPTPADIAPLLVCLGDAHRRMNEVFASRSDEWLLAPSALPEWSRLTIACHLRYVAEAMLRVTDAARLGTVALMYPGGRDADRPLSLVPRRGETPAHVVESLRATAAELESRWSNLPLSMWTDEFTEVDHGTLLFSRWLALRLTEVEIHSTDVGVHAGPDCLQWSESFVRLLLPLRVAWLLRARERSDADLSSGGCWVLGAGAHRWFVRSDVGSRVVSVGVEGPFSDAVVLTADDRTLLALLLGRDGDYVAGVLGPQAKLFKSAFPGP